ncbi:MULTISPECIES: hypothetical protein [Olivibacter]|uniref:Uncharacterized protein n=1 Tax=Olivibacter oleidegradans TaxID=760123 RepID=A0ABV6HR68_9SPHI|nr:MULTISPECIES: hypothetical protein [Olivibacter]
MKKNTKDETIKRTDLHKNLKLIIKPVRNTRARIRQLLRSFIPLLLPEDVNDIYQQFPN